MASCSHEISWPDATHRKYSPVGEQNDSFSQLDRLSLKEILDEDRRPTFVVDLEHNRTTGHGIQPIFVNASLKGRTRLLSNVTRETNDSPSVKVSSSATTYDNFRNWATAVSEQIPTEDAAKPFQFDGILWTSSTVRQRWRIISGDVLPRTTEVMAGELRSASSPKIETGREHLRGIMPAEEMSTEATGNHKRERASTNTIDKSDTTLAESSLCMSLSTPEGAVLDWTVPHPCGMLTKYMVFARTVDWTSTPLGPMEEWSIQVRELANLIMRIPYPAAILWGEEHTMLYNEAYATEIAGKKHPMLMGTGMSNLFPESWAGVGPVFHECARTGHSQLRPNDPVPIDRHGYLEETFLTWSIVPIYGGTNHILGFYNTPVETTRETINSRRMHTLHHLGESLHATRTVKDFWRCVLGGLEHNHYDVPLALMYSIVDPDDTATTSHSWDSTNSLKLCLLEGAVGIPIGHTAASPKLDLTRSQEGFTLALREAMRTREPTTISERDGSLPAPFLKGIKCRGFGDPCKEAVVFPLRPPNEDSVLAFLLLGINPRKAVDDDYRTFITLLNRQLETSLSSVILFEDEVRRNKQAAETAAKQEEQLLKQLELQTGRMRRMTELSPLGMYLFDPRGVLVEANEKYMEMTGFRRGDADAFAFLNVVAKESQTVAHEMWDEMMTTMKPVTREIQLKPLTLQPRDLSGDPIEYWVLASSAPQLNSNGEVISIMGSLADISHMKWVHGLQETRLREAEETKRQQNEFVDITSHEMRNPLSATLICADDIRDTLTQHKFQPEDQQVVGECIEAAKNIVLCVQHQKSIVDDILTVSKLDSKLLRTTPVPAQPISVVKHAMTMFYPECQAKGIEFRFAPHPCLKLYNIDWVLLDPTRLLQITINLITNAIKFTQHSTKRSIIVHLSVSPEHPELYKSYDYIPKRGLHNDVAAGEDWGSGQVLYIHVDVEDSGCGLTDEEKAVLFEKFAQASPRTHVTYGGSGLGLYISRQLAELHGGQIGVSSKAGVGSTFGFFLKCQRLPSGGNRLSVSRRESANSIVEAALDLHPAIFDALLLPNSTNLNILLVEDNLVNQRVLKKQLTKAGCTITTADNGLYALDHLTTTRFQTASTDGLPLDIILMDWEMPEMDGLTCCKKIREMEKSGELNAHVPILGVTANVRSEQISIAKENGMDDILPKPFRVPELLEKIRCVLRRLEDGGGLEDRMSSGELEHGR